MQVEHWYKDTYIAMEPHSIKYVGPLLKDYHPQMIIEFGTYHGGFTKYLCDWFPDVPIYSVDLVRMVSAVDEKYFRENGNVTLITSMELFKGGLLIPPLVNSSKRKFLFCDNGNKIDEVKLYAGYLRPNDLLGIHDWGTEIKQEDIKFVLEGFDAHPINQLLIAKKCLSRFFIKKDYSGAIKILNDYYKRCLKAT